MGGQQYLSNNDTSKDGFVSKTSGGYAVGSMPQDKQLLIILPKETYDFGKTAVVGVAQGVIWWKPDTPVTYKLAKRCNESAKISNLSPITHMIPLHAGNAHRFQFLFDESSSTTDPCVPEPPKLPPPTATTAESAPEILDEIHQSKPAGPEREATTDGHSLRIHHGRSFPVRSKAGTCVY